MIAITDFHSHILPCVDDGSKSVEESLAMLRTAGKQGIRQMVATPHFYAEQDTLEAFLRRREAAAECLWEGAKRYPGLPQVILGAEVRYFPGIGSSVQLPELAIQGTRCILIEMPPLPWTSFMLWELEELWSGQGLVPVIAHIDRYIRPLRTYGIPVQLWKYQILVQANASFFLKWETSGLAMRLLREDKIHLLGSDCHNMNSRSPNLVQALGAIEKKLGPSAIARLHEHEQSVWQNNDVEI